MSNAGDFVIENGVLKKYVGSGGDVSVPEGVTSIGKEAFSGCRRLTSVTIPDSVTSIGSGAFWECGRLTSIILPKGLTDIGSQAFYGCKDLKDSEGFVILQGVLFDYFGAGRNVTIPVGVRSIGFTAFRSCRSMKSVTIPMSVTSIGGSAFEFCENLSSVTIPAGVTSIGRDAFAYCKNLNSVTILGSATSIGKNVFSCCNNLKLMTVRHWPRGLQGPINDHIFTLCCTEDGISSIPANYRPNALLGLISEPELDMDSERTRSYLEYAKRNAGKLIKAAFEKPELLYFLCTHDLIPAKDSDTYMAEAEKRGNLELKALLLEYQNKLGVGRISKAREKKEKNKEDYVDALAERIAARDLTKGIEGITFVITGKLNKWDSRSEIKAYLEVCGAHLASTITKKTDYLVTNDAGSETEKNQKAREYGVPTLTEEDFNEMVCKRYKDAESISVPFWVREIPNGAFEKCKSLKSVTIPAGVTNIGDSVFYGCKNLTSITLPQSLTSIGRWAFLFCTNLSSVTIPDSVTSFGKEVFTGCPNLTIHAPEGSYAEQYAKEHDIPFAAE